MKERKYKEDWVNETRIDDTTGKEKRVPVYRGPVFRRMTGQERGSMLSWAFFPWLFFITLILLYFKLYFPGSTVLYIFLPAALSLFPALYWALGIWTAFRSGRNERQKGLQDRNMTRLEKENGIGRVLRSAAGCMICAATAVVGDIVFLFLSGQAAAEIPGTAMLLAAALTALGTMNQFRKFNLQTEEGGKNT